MKIRSILSVAAVGGALITAAPQQADAISLTFGDVEIGFYGGGNLYDLGLNALPRSPLGGAGSPPIGGADYTALRANDLTVNGSPLPGVIPAVNTEITGIVTFLEVKQFVTPLPDLARVLLDDAARNPDPTPGGIGRFFLFDSTPDIGGIAADFTNTGPGDVDWYDPIMNPNTVTDGVNSWGIDHLTGFSRDAANNQYDLLLTGYIVPLFHAGVGDDGLLLNLFESPSPGIAFTGQTDIYAVVVDGGKWFLDGEVTQAQFDFGFTGFDGTTPPGFSPQRQDVFDGGWQLDLDDPLTFFYNPIPEPVSVGLAGLGLLAAAGAATRRRRD
ncbi:MAG: hypothetical protein JJU36_09120 [Phycisphaeraceae bacterium]|nr:hypothetical protein [Phycisphaeraceae bacterium]